MSAANTASRLLVAVAVITVAVGGCYAGSTAPDPSTRASAASSATLPADGSLVIVGRIVTMDDPPVAEAVFIEDGQVTAVGARDDVLALAGKAVRTVDIGSNVAYPGFIDAHAHWIGDRNYYDIDTPAEAMDAAIARGWTSISEQWNDAGKLEELIGLASGDALSLRVDAYLALNGVHPGEHYGDWYTDRKPEAVDDRLRVQGVKIHLDNGSGKLMLWEAPDLTAAIDRANALGWQISVHSVSTEAQEMALDAFEAALGPSGPNPLHHRIEHAVQVTDEQLARLAAMDLTVVTQLDGVATDWISWAATVEDEDYRRDYEASDVSWLGRWRDFVNAGLHVAGSSDAPWFFTEAGLTDDIGRPVDEIAGGMDGRGRSYPETRPWALDELLTAEEGLRAVTVEAAWALRDEERRGHLAAGTLGDVTILSGDATAGTPDEIRALDVIATIVGGEIVYCADPEICAR